MDIIALNDLRIELWVAPKARPITAQGNALGFTRDSDASAEGATDE